jgi:RecB family endonuclease NucS
MAKRQLEKEWQTFLSKAYHPCQIEVKTPVGNIDILTPTKLIEIKRSDKWKHAIGQLLSYSEFYPTQQKYLYLFGDLNIKQLNEAYRMCKLHNIILTISFYDSPETHIIVRGFKINLDNYSED